ncbi:MAG: DUF2330 domain-containing protein [Pseudomonadota bacterium]
MLTRSRTTRSQRGRGLTMLAAAAALAALAGPAHAFCGFYVAKADGELFNEASKVVMARDGDRTVITMANDYQGAPQDFAMVIPTPVVLREDQINVAEAALIDRIDAYSAPRLVEYFDENPCARPAIGDLVAATALPEAAPASPRRRAESLGVTIEAEYTVGEYDIVILSAEESGGLQTWLSESGYRTPEETKPVLASYIAQDMKFFVAKVNLAEQAKSGGQFLRPLQISFESEKYMLPIRLGTVNAKGKQDLLLFALSRKGRVETANYPTRKIPSDLTIPLFVQEEFGAFYKAMFQTASDRAGGRAVFTEYAWDMNWCDPCAADPLTVSELQGLGVFWLDPNAPNKGGAVDVYVTRLHVSYDGESFPEDLRLMATGDRRNFQARFITRHPFDGAADCPAGRAYREELARGYERQAQTLANLTGWDISEVRAKMAANGQDPTPPSGDQPDWWNKIWEDG